MSSTVTLGYSPNDFFYVDATNQGIMPDKEKCEALKPYDITWDVSCSPAPHMFDDASFNCVQKELCINYDKASKIMEKENTHGGANKQYADVNLKYDIAFMDVINLGIGILFAIIIIYKNRNVK